MRFILSLLASLKFALVVILLIALACVVGTLIPQGEQQVAAYLAQRPDAHQILRTVDAMGLTHVFSSLWFVTLMFVLATSLAVCTTRRYATIGRVNGAVRVRVIGSFITHVGLLLVFAGGVTRVIWGQKGVIQLHEGETVNLVESQSEPFHLPFSVRLVKFDLEFYKTPAPPSGPQTDKLIVEWADKNLRNEFPVELNVAHSVVWPDAPAGAETAFTIKVLRYVPDFAIAATNGEAQSRSAEPNNPAVLVSVTGGGRTNTQWVFAHFPDFSNHAGANVAAPMPLTFRFKSASDAMAVNRHELAPIKAFKSSLELLDGGAVVRAQTVVVNAPLGYRGYTFYQSGYDPEDLTWTALQVVRDPGVMIVYSGFVLMMLGLTVVFCVGPWLESQRRTKGWLS